MSSYVPTPNPAAGNRILMAVRLGWLTVEVMGRLRDYVQSGRRREARPGDASRRFNFSDQRLSEYDLLLLTVDQLHRTVTRFDLVLPAPPLPEGDELEQQLTGRLDLDVLQGQLDDWSTQAWIILSTEDELPGRAFNYGGSLADTYWHAPVLGPDRFSELLRPQRLEYISARLDSLSLYLPPYTAQVLRCTLHKWRIQETVDRLEPAGRKNVLRRLEAQAKVWHNLLFGSRSPESYLRPADQRLITAGAMGATVILAAAVVILMWLVVLTLSSTGLTVAASMAGLSQELSQGQAAFVGDLIDWQVWSVVLATVSSLVAIIIGLISRLSGWVIKFYHLAREWLKLRMLCRRAYRR